MKEVGGRSRRAKAPSFAGFNDTAEARRLRPDPFMHRDLLGQAFAAMRHDLRKTMLTMAGMAWGIATVVLLLAYGNGFGTAIHEYFSELWGHGGGDISGADFATGGRK